MKKIDISKIISLSLAVSMLMLTSCSQKLPPETMPPETAATTVTEETTASEETTEETTTESSEESSETTVNPNHGPFSTAVATEMPLEKYGQLSLDGLNIVSESGEIVQLRGMSTYGMTGLINEAFVQTLAEDWCCDVIRFAMYVARANGGCYVDDPETNFNNMCNYIDMCVDQGVYVIVDWHILEYGDPNQYKDEAIDFFTRISAIYGDCPNVIYEICNEPNGMRYDDPSAPVDWECIREYAEEVIPAIRANDPDNLIICGTPTWSSDVDIVSLDPLDEENVLYTFHFYAGSNGQDYRDKVITALDNGLPIFVSEWGTSLNSGGGGVFPEESRLWTDFMAENNLSWCNWSIGGSNPESSNALRYNSRALTPSERGLGHWPDEFISQSGLFVRSVLLGIEYVPETDGDTDTDSQTDEPADPETGESAETAEDTEATETE